MTTTLSDVTLDIRSSNCGSPAFAKAATLVASTSNPQSLSYSYQYAGGSDTQGNETVPKGQGEQSFLVKLIADSRYHLVDVSFGTGNTQLSKHDQDTYKVTIKDADDAVETDYYQLSVKDTSNGDCTFLCDPRVTNTDPD
ncbi:hypothetical protein F3N42_01275 [Marinihelvus fidelis]|uniref:Uncharacterized protein n=1 Tax=Marinihelvus fidelis TaxID=2613842 RepID=A0A5N0TGB0_9GAMM|nr:hypothetical protein [Marinihelvus fidelis]KAA9134203.1 hypothetical protein F3N42_01275 [Marinihelvus fidelis]